MNIQIVNNVQTSNLRLRTYRYQNDFLLIERTSYILIYHYFIWLSNGPLYLVISILIIKDNYYWTHLKYRHDPNQLIPVFYNNNLIHAENIYVIRLCKNASWKCRSLRHHWYDFHFSQHSISNMFTPKWDETGKNIAWLQLTTVKQIFVIIIFLLTCANINCHLNK